MFVLFRGYNNEAYSTWIESILGMFRMSLGAFGEIYDTFDDSIQDSVYIWFPRVSSQSLAINTVGCQMLLFSFLFLEKRSLGFHPR